VSAGAIIAYDRRGVLVASAARELDPVAASDAAALAIAASKGASAENGLLAERVSAPGAVFSIVAVTPQHKQTDIGWRAAVIVVAPILVAALSFAFVWLALDWWVLRWFYRLQDMAQDFGAGRYAPAAMSGAPAEIGALSTAFDIAVRQARTRERELAEALAANKSLTRELHHRVKNNLQVLSSLVSRQQRRTEEAPVRYALGEARARMAPVALIYRFINPPEERTAINLQPYLSELTRQLHFALGGIASGVRLDVQVAPGLCSADDATNIGLIVAETLISGYANAVGAGGAAASVTFGADENEPRTLRVGVKNDAPSGAERALDCDLVMEIARQLNAIASFEPPATITLALHDATHTSAHEYMDKV
jgi:two-component sensor histidine kinase